MLIATGKFAGKTSEEVFAGLNAKFNVFLLEVQKLMSERGEYWQEDILDKKEKISALCQEGSQALAADDKGQSEALMRVVFYFDQVVYEITNQKQLGAIVTVFKVASPSFVPDPALNLAL